MAAAVAARSGFDLLAVDLARVVVHVMLGLIGAIRNPPK